MVHRLGTVLAPPSKSAIFQARVRLGPEPVEALFRRTARPLADPDTPGSWLAGRRLVAIDGTCLDVADSEANKEHFGRLPASRGERSAFPRDKVVALAECGTHAVFDALIGPCSISEIVLARDVVSRLELELELELGMLVVADRTFYGFGLRSAAQAAGADLLWRVKANLRPHHLQDLDDGSWLARIKPTSGTDRAKTEPLAVRLIDYMVEDGRENPERYRLLTTSWTRPPFPRPTSRQPTPSAGRSRPPSTNSRPTSAGPGPCCAPNPRP